MAVLDRTRTRTHGAAGLGIVLAGVATVVWSGSFVVSRALHDSVPPVQQALWRWVIAPAAVAPFAGREAEAAEAYELLGAGVVTRELAGDRPHRHVVAAVRRGAEEGAAVGRVLEALREAAAGLGERR